MQIRRGVFVFGSNKAGKHGAGAAKIACQNYGAIYGIGEGLTGQSYALPTKDYNLKVLPLDAIEEHVARFIECASTYRERFWVTAIGCGLAGYRASQIAPMFKPTVSMINVFLPIQFTRVLQCSERISFDEQNQPYRKP